MHAIAALSVRSHLMPPALRFYLPYELLSITYHVNQIRAVLFNTFLSLPSKWSYIRTILAIVPLFTTNSAASGLPLNSVLPWFSRAPHLATTTSLTTFQRSRQTCFAGTALLANYRWIMYYFLTALSLALLPVGCHWHKTFKTKTPWLTSTYQVGPSRCQVVLESALHLKVV